MLVTLCIPPALPPVSAQEWKADSSCRSFSDLVHAAEWLRQHQIELPCLSQGRWP